MLPVVGGPVAVRQVIVWGSSVVGWLVVLAGVLQFYIINIFRDNIFILQIETAALAYCLSQL